VQYVALPPEPLEPPTRAAAAPSPAPVARAALPSPFARCEDAAPVIRQLAAETAAAEASAAGAELLALAASPCGLAAEPHNGPGDSRPAAEQGSSSQPWRTHVGQAVAVAAGEALTCAGGELHAASSLGASLELTSAVVGPVAVAAAVEAAAGDPHGAWASGGGKGSGSLPPLSVSLPGSALEPSPTVAVEPLAEGRTGGASGEGGREVGGGEFNVVLLLSPVEPHAADGRDEGEECGARGAAPPAPAALARGASGSGEWSGRGSSGGGGEGEGGSGSPTPRAGGGGSAFLDRDISFAIRGPPPGLPPGEAACDEAGQAQAAELSLGGAGSGSPPHAPRSGGRQPGYGSGAYDGGTTAAAAARQLYDGLSEDDEAEAGGTASRGSLQASAAAAAAAAALSDGSLFTTALAAAGVEAEAEAEEGEEATSAPATGLATPSR
jgi:hypothetical protein